MILEALPRMLRFAGFAIAPDMTRDFLAAVAAVPCAHPRRLFWVAAAVFVRSPEELVRFEDIFRRWLTASEAFDVASDETESAEEQKVDGREPSKPGRLRVESGEGTGREASDLDGKAGEKPRALEDEAALLTAIAEGIAHALPRRPIRRLAPADTGAVLDLAAALRQEIAFAGEFEPLPYRDAPRRPRPLLMMIDISGSMKSASLDALKVAHALARALRDVEVFCFGTRLTRVTGLLKRCAFDAALTRLGATLGDWDGGTRIGDSLQRFLAKPQHAALIRGAVTLVVSDGFERGEPSAMVSAVERMSRLSHRLLWLTPMMTDERYRPETRGLKSALPAIDLMADCSSLAAWAKLPSRLSALEAETRGRAPRQFVTRNAA